MTQRALSRGGSLMEGRSKGPSAGGKQPAPTTLISSRNLGAESGTHSFALPCLKKRMLELPIDPDSTHEL